MPSPTPNGLPANRRAFGVHLDVPAAERLKDIATARGTTPSAVLREIIASAVDGTTAPDLVDLPPAYARGRQPDVARRYFGVILPVEMSQSLFTLASEKQTSQSELVRSALALALETQEKNGVS